MQCILVQEPCKARMVWSFSNCMQSRGKNDSYLNFIPLQRLIAACAFGFIPLKIDSSEIETISSNTTPITAICVTLIICIQRNHLGYIITTYSYHY